MESCRRFVRAAATSHTVSFTHKTMLKPTRTLVAALAVALLAGCATRPASAPSAIPAGASPQGAAAAQAAVPRYSIEDFMATTRIAGASFSPDGRKLLFSSNQTGIFNVYEVPSEGGTPVQLTHSTGDAIFLRGYFPDDERFLYSSDAGGNELSHIYVRERDGTVRDLTPGEKVRATFQGWAHDNRSFFIATNERDARFMDLYEYATDGYARTLVFQNDGGFFLGPVSRDKRYLALLKPRTTNDSDVYLYDRETRQLRNLTEHTGQVSNNPSTFTPDSRALLYTTDEGHEFAHLVRYDLATGEKTVVLKPDWDVWGAGFSRNGTYLVVSINNDARTELRLFEAASMRPVALPPMPDANITGVHFSRDESRMAFFVNDSRTPSDLFVAELGGEPRRLTRSLNPRIERSHLVDGEVVRFDSYDGVEIPGIIYRPHGATAARRAPALVMVHGGPGGQARIGYSGLIQFLVNQGYVVYDINNRGSSGYGKTFFAMDDRRHGEADLGDVVASKQMLIETGYVDPDRVGIIGGSYGGFMVLAALAFQPDVFDVGVNIFGVSNWLRTLQSIPPWWEAQREALYTEMGDPVEDEERLRRISPLFHAHNIKRPLIVLQGANDPRVLQVESDEIVEAVRRNNVPVEYIVFPDEGHGFVNRENEIRGYRAIAEFLEVHLKGKP
jgi:dipeptidyl aminopeptidase/acylaminoacyl peptidase